MNLFETYIWDLDGTLIDSYGSIVSSLLEISGRCGAPDSREDILKAVKRGSVSGYLRKLAEESGEDYQTLYARYREISHDRLEEITLIPGAKETLEALEKAGARHDLYTHRGASTRGLLDRLGLTSFFREIVTFERGFPPKPSGAGVRYLVDKYGLNRERTAYVGDRGIDVQCARDAGVQAVLYLPEDSCVTPTGLENHIIRRLEDLLI